MRRVKGLTGQNPGDLGRGLPHSTASFLSVNIARAGFSTATGYVLAFQRHCHCWLLTSPGHTTGIACIGLLEAESR